MEREGFMRVDQTIPAAEKTSIKAILTLVDAIILLTRNTDLLIEKISETITPQQLV